MKFPTDLTSELVPPKDMASVSSRTALVGIVNWTGCNIVLFGMLFTTAGFASAVQYWLAAPLAKALVHEAGAGKPDPLCPV